MSSARSISAGASVIALALVLAVLCAYPAQAGGPESLRESLFGLRPSMPDRSQTLPVAHYVSQQGEAFTLDRSQARPLLKIDDNPEVWALKAQPAPRGDVLYMNDLGEPVLRATRLGGLTLFTSDQPGGSAVALAGASTALRLPPLSPQQVFERLALASARATRAARRLIAFEAESSPASSALMADAALVASEAVIRLSHKPEAKPVLARLLKVRLVEGRKAGANFNQGVMQITVAPAEGFAGRPSSDRIMAAAGSR